MNFNSMYYYYFLKVKKYFKTIIDTKYISKII